jgi:hypothetical protein
MKKEALFIVENENILSLRLPGYRSINNLLPGIFMKNYTFS